MRLYANPACATICSELRLEERKVLPSGVSTLTCQGTEETGAEETATGREAPLSTFGKTLGFVCLSSSGRMVPTAWYNG